MLQDMSQRDILLETAVHQITLLIMDTEYEDLVNCVNYCYYANTPKNYEKPVSCPDGREWGEVMNVEFNSLEENKTFMVSDLPTGKSLVMGEWVFTVKGDPDNPSYKARYVR